MQWAETSGSMSTEMCLGRFPYSAVSEARGLSAYSAGKSASTALLKPNCCSAAALRQPHRIDTRELRNPEASPLHRMKAEYKQQFTCVRDAMKCKF